MPAHGLAIPPKPPGDKRTTGRRRDEGTSPGNEAVVHAVLTGTAGSSGDPTDRSFIVAFGSGFFILFDGGFVVTCPRTAR